MSGRNSRKREEELEKRVELLAVALLKLVSCDEVGNWYTDMARDEDVTDIIGDLLD